MKTTLELPPELMRAIKLRAVLDNRKLKDAIADLLRRGMARDASAPRAPRRRVRLPLIRCAHPAPRGEEITPERAARILLDGESRAARGAVR